MTTRKTTQQELTEAVLKTYVDSLVAEAIHGDETSPEGSEKPSQKKKSKKKGVIANLLKMLARLGVLAASGGSEALTIELLRQTESQIKKAKNAPLSVVGQAMLADIESKVGEFKRVTSAQPRDDRGRFASKARKDGNLW